MELDIPVFSGGYGTSFYEETARQFEVLRPGMRVRLYGDPRIADQVSVRVMDGHPPDATSAGYVPWPALIKAGKVLDLTPYLQGPDWEGDAPWGDHVPAGGPRLLAGRWTGLWASLRVLLLEPVLQPRDVPGPWMGETAHLGGFLRLV